MKIWTWCNIFSTSLELQSYILKYLCRVCCEYPCYLATIYTDTHAVISFIYKVLIILLQYMQKYFVLPNDTYRPALI